jgi:hypothetical protein
MKKTKEPLTKLQVHSFITGTRGKHIVGGAHTVIPTPNQGVKESDCCRRPCETADKLCV